MAATMTATTVVAEITADILSLNAGGVSAHAGYLSYHSGRENPEPASTRRPSPTAIGGEGQKDLLGDGITVADATETMVIGNLVGTDRTGTANLGNGGDGIILGNAGAPDNTISNNIIAFNQQDGIEDRPDYRFSVAYTTSGHQGNAFLQNSIFSNGMLGIDLRAPGTGGNIWAPQGVPLQNTPGGPHQGGNLLQNYPVLNSAISSTAGTVITGSLNSTPNETFHLEFFASPTANASGYGEGKTYLGDTSVTTDASGNASFSVTVPEGNLAGQVLSSTATDPGNNTSEFSADIPIQTEPVLSFGSTLSPSTYGQSVSFSVAVQPFTGGPTPTGNVQFLVNGANLGGVAALVDGQATSPSIANLPAGTYSIGVNYLGDSFYAAASAAGSQVVNQAPLTLVVDNQSMNHYDPVPTLTYHYAGFVLGENATTAGIVDSVSLSTTATSTSDAGYYPITAAINSFAASNYFVTANQGGTMTVMPKVMDVRVDFGSESMSLIGLSRDLPFVNIKAIDVIFSDNVNIAGSMLQLTGVNLANYSLSLSNYNAKTFDATWTLPSAIGVDHLMLALDGETAAPVLGTGPDIAANPFSNTFAVLPGDINGDGVVSASDLSLAVQAMSQTYNVWADLEGTGVITIADAQDVRKHMGTHL